MTQRRTASLRLDRTLLARTRILVDEERLLDRSWTGRWPSPVPGTEHPALALAIVGKGQRSLQYLLSQHKENTEVNRAEAKSLG